MGNNLGHRYLKLEGHLRVVDLWVIAILPIDYLNTLFTVRFYIHFIIRKEKFILRKKGSWIFYFLGFCISGMMIFFFHTGITTHVEIIFLC